MKFIVNSATLLTALEIVKKAHVKNPIVPIIENYLFRVSNQVLTISGTDLYTTIKLSWRIECNADTTFSAVVPPNIITYLKKLDDQPITFTWNQESYSIELLEETGRAKYSGENAEDFPRCPQTNTPLFETTSDLFKEFKDLLNYASGDNQRPAMNGIGFMGYEGFSMCATDGNRLKMVKVPELNHMQNNISEYEYQHFILPANAAKILSSLNFQPKARGKVKAIAELPEGVTVCAGYIDQITEDEKIVQKLHDISFLFTYSVFDMEVITRVIYERFPQYWNVIPQTSTTQYTIDKKRFLSTLDKAVLFANKTTHQIRVALNGVNKMSAEDLDFSNEYCAEIGGTYTGEPIEIGFNGEYLRETINSFEEVTLEMTAPNRAAVIRHGNSLALVMPVMLTQYSA